MGTSPSNTPRIAITTGEPAGIGPDLVLALSQRDWPVSLVAIGDPCLLSDRAKTLGMSIKIQRYNDSLPASAGEAGNLVVDEITMDANCVPGTLNANNGQYVIDTLERACLGCVEGEFDAMVTAPVHKSIINDAGIPFSGHTEYLAEKTCAPLPVMLLVADKLRVALLTTHLPLSAVPEQVTAKRIEATIKILDAGLRKLFGILTPSIAVLGLNPHAGESGHLGSEEVEIIAPTLERLREEGIKLAGPLPADTAMINQVPEQFDAFLAMYHDQGLPVLKYAGFGKAVNITLGLPIIRTSVDHGTALSLAATGKADQGSMLNALHLAISLVNSSASAP